MEGGHAGYWTSPDPHSAAAIESSRLDRGKLDGSTAEEKCPEEVWQRARRAPHDGRAATCSLVCWSGTLPCAGSWIVSTPTRLSLIVWSRNSFVWRCRLSWKVVVIFMSRGDELLRYYFAESGDKIM